MTASPAIGRRCGLAVAVGVALATVAPIGVASALPGDENDRRLPRLQGAYTYSVANGGDDLKTNGRYSTPCGGCAATGEDGQNLQWTGAGWSHNYPDECGTVQVMLIPKSIKNGVATRLSSTTWGGCLEGSVVQGSLVWTDN